MTTITKSKETRIIVCRLTFERRKFKQAVTIKQDNTIHAVCVTYLF